MRRIIGKTEGASPDAFTNECVDRLLEELDVIMYYGSSSQKINLPNRPGKGALWTIKHA